MTPIEIVADVSRRLTARNIRHLVGGSFASSAWGEVRATNDVDVAVLIRPDEAGLLASAFEPPYYASAESVAQALEEPGLYRSTHAIHMDEAFQIDLFLVRPDAYSITEFERARPVEVVNGTFVLFSAPENVVLQKLRRFDQTNRVSDRQWNDVVCVLEVQRMNLDYAYLQRWAAELGVAELLAEALAQRIDEDPFADEKELPSSFFRGDYAAKSPIFQREEKRGGVGGGAKSVIGKIKVPTRAVKPTCPARASTKSTDCRTTRGASFASWASSPSASTASGW